MISRILKIQYQKYIDAGYKSTNIETKFIKNIADINFNITNKKYKEVAISAHWSQNGIKLSNNGDTINSDTVSLLKKSSNQNLTLTLVSCMTGYGDDSIAEQIAKRMWITVMAPSSILNVFNEAEFMDWWQHTPWLNYNWFQFVESQILSNINWIWFPAQFYSYN